MALKHGLFFLLQLFGAVCVSLTTWLFVGYRERPGCRMVFHGNENGNGPPGSCWCAEDSYCMCTPSMSVDVILENAAKEELLLVQRQDGRGNAIVGGFIKVGESAEDAAAREVMEETGLILDKHHLKQFHVFSDPARDPRRHTASVTFIGRASQPWDSASAADDAKNIVVASTADIRAGKVKMAFDHDKILAKYFEAHPK